MKGFASPLRKWLSNLPIKDAVQRPMASLVQVILLGFIAVILLAAMLNLVLPAALPWQIVLVQSSIIIFIISIPLVLLRRGYFRSSVFIIISFFCILEAFAVTTAGLREIAETLQFFTLSMILAGLLLGRRALALTFLFSAGVILLSVFQEQNADVRMDSIVIAGNFILLNGLMSVFLDQFGLTLRRALTAALEREGELQTEIDIRGQVEEALRASQTKFQGLFDSSPDAIIVTDRDGRIVQINAQVEALFGYQAAALIGQPIEVLLPARFQKGHSQYRAGFMTEPRQRLMGMGLELHGCRKDRSEFPVDINLGTLATEAGLVVLATVRDITERKQAEAVL
jgi:PAS domain S-box-containing protein